MTMPIQVYVLGSDLLALLVSSMYNDMNQIHVTFVMIGTATLGKLQMIHHLESSEVIPNQVVEVVAVDDVGLPQL